MFIEYDALLLYRLPHYKVGRKTTLVGITGILFLLPTWLLFLLNTLEVLVFVFAIFLNFKFFYEVDKKITVIILPSMVTTGQINRYLDNFLHSE